MSAVSPATRTTVSPATRTTVLTATTLVAFAMNSFFCRAALASGLTDAVSFTTLRFCTGAACLGAVAVRRGPTRDGDPRIALGSAIALLLYAIPFSVAYTRIPTGAGALLLFGAVQLTMIGSAMRARAHPTPGEWTGLALSLCGLVVLTRPGLARPDPVGTLLMLAAGAAWGVYSLRGRVSRDPVSANALAFAFAAAACVVLSLAMLPTGSLRLGAAGAGLAIASGAISTGLGYVIWYTVLPSLSATRAALVQLTVPPLAASAGMVFLGEALTIRFLAACVLVLGGIAVAVVGSARRA